MMLVTGPVGCAQSSSDVPPECVGDAATSPAEPVVFPSNSVWQTVLETLPAREGGDYPFPLSIDPGTCTEGTWSAWLAFGSAYAGVHRRDDGACEVWLGGETENPMYDGLPTEYCRFPSVCAPVAASTQGGGGPATIGGPYCVDR